MPSALVRPKHPLLVFDREAIEGDEVVDPAHGQHVASCLPGPAGPDERDVSREANRWIGQASCWVAGTRCPSVPAIGVNGARSAGAADGATSRHASAPKAITRFTPPADTSGVRGRRKAPTASAAVNPRSEVELEEMVRVGALREDPELRQREGHVQLLATWLRRPYARACASPIALDDARDRLQ